MIFASTEAILRWYQILVLLRLEDVFIFFALQVQTPLNSTS